MVEAGETGTYHTPGTHMGTTWGAMFEAIREGVNSDATITYAPEDWLLAQEVSPWTDLPLWLTEADIGLMQPDTSRATAKGFTVRPLAETARDTWAWRQAEDWDQRWGMSRERETELLSLWHDQ